MTEKTVVIWDYDGTLLDNVEVMAKAATAAFAVFGIQTDLQMFQDTFTTPITDMYKAILKDHKPTDEEMQQSQQAYISELQKHQDKLTLRTNTEEVLQQIKQNGHDMVVISNHKEPALVEEVNKFGINHFFNKVSGRALSTSPVGQTTKGDRVLQYLNDNGIAPTNAVIIGDTLEEHHIAQRLGIQCISITGGSVSETRLRNGGCQHIVHSMEDIPAKITKLLTPA